MMILDFKSKHFDERDPKFQDFQIDYNIKTLKNCNYFNKKDFVIIFIKNNFLKKGTNNTCQAAKSLNF